MRSCFYGTGLFLFAAVPSRRSCGELKQRARAASRAPLITAGLGHRAATQKTEVDSVLVKMDDAYTTTKSVADSVPTLGLTLASQFTTTSQHFGE